MAAPRSALSGLGLAKRLWRLLKSGLRPAPIATADGLRGFIEERAALIAQKCATDYCRGKTGLASYALFAEEPFIKAFDICRWETFAVALGDLLILAEGFLRPHVEAGQHPRLVDAVVGMHATVLAALPSPAHRAEGWKDVVASFGKRVEDASRAEPQQALDVADHTAKRLFETLPIHIRMRRLDEEVVYGAVRFRMIAVSQEMRGRVRPAEVVKQLLLEG